MIYLSRHGGRLLNLSAYKMYLSAYKMTSVISVKGSTPQAPAEPLGLVVWSELDTPF